MFSALYDFDQRYSDQLQTIYKEGSLCGTFTPMPADSARNIVDNTMKNVFNWLFNQQRTSLEQSKSCSTSMETVVSLTTIVDVR